jgi:hypothetical protein
MLRQLDDMGVHRVVVPAWVFDTTGDLRGSLARVGERIFSQFAPA